MKEGVLRRHIVEMERLRVELARKGFDRLRRHFMRAAGEALTGNQIFEIERHVTIDSKKFVLKRLTPLARMPEGA